MATFPRSWSALQPWTRFKGSNATSPEPRSLNRRPHVHESLVQATPTHPLADRLTPVGLVLLIVLVRLPGIFEPAWYSDDGFFTTIAWAWSRGLPLYSGVFDNSPPMIYWLYDLAQRLGSLEHHVVTQLWATAAVVVAALLTLDISRRVLPRWPAALAATLAGLALSLPVLDGDLMNVEVAALPFFLGALRLAFSRRAALVFASGTLLGIAVLTRPSFAVEACALALPLLASPGRLRRIALAVCGGALPVAAAAVALASQGSLVPYLAVVMPADHAYLIWSNGGTLLPLLVRLTALTAASLIGLRSARTPAARLASVWLPAAIAAASLTPREFSHYAQEAIPALSFTVAMVAGRVRRRWLVVVPAALAVILGSEATLILPAEETSLVNWTGPPRVLLHNFSYQQTPGYYSNFFDLALGRESAATYADRFPQSFAIDRSETEFLKAQPGAAGSRLIVLGDRPWLYVKASMLPGSRYIATNSAYGRVPSAPGELARALSNSCAGFVVDDSGVGDWKRALDAGGYVRLSGAPLPTYRSAGAPGNCG
jgi:hypothetical protein